VTKFILNNRTLDLTHSTSWSIKGYIHCHSALGSFHILIQLLGLHSLSFWTWFIPHLDPSRVTFMDLAHSTSWSIKGYIHCHSALGSFHILIHQGLHSLPFWTWFIPHLHPSRVTFMDLAHSTSWYIKGYIYCHSALGSFHILIHQGLHSWTWLIPHLGPSRVTFTAILDLTYYKGMQCDWWSDHSPWMFKMHVTEVHVP
jgi:hypothetical protein